jgi:hypothetical protein
MGASWWASCACALVVGLHPIAAATVPSLPRRQDLVVGVLLIGSMSLIARAGLGEPHVRWRWLLGAMALFFLALGGKEIAYAGVVLIPLIGTSAWWRAAITRDEATRLLRASVPIVVGFVLLVAIAFWVRWRVLGGLGGYLGTAALLGSSQGIIEFFVRPYITDVLWPFHSVMPDRLRDWLFLIGLVGLVVVIATAGFGAQRRFMVIAGVIWQAAFLALYGVVHTSLSPYLLYVPLAGLGLLVTGLLDGAADRLKQSTAVHLWAGFTSATGLVAGAGSAFLLLGVLRTSALVTDYPEFRDAGSASKQFIDQAIPCLASAPAGVVVSIDGLPHRIEYASAESQFIDAYVFEAYSLESVQRLLAPESRAQIVVRSTQDVTRRPPSLAVTCSRAGDQWQISAQLR